MQWTIIVALGLLGLCFGSFVNALVWRLKTKRNFVSERSECTHCHHQLAAKDLIPIVSWLLLKGKCRYCHKPISWQYPVVELVVALLFVGSYLFWPLPLSTWYLWLHFGFWLTYLVILCALFVYDLRWLLLPDKLTYPLLALTGVDALLTLFLINHLSVGAAALEVLLGLLSIGGFYGLLFIISRGKWVGLGDVKLGAALGLVLGWQRGLLVIVIANLIGTCFVVPGLLSGRLNRRSKIPFGPFLIIAFVITGVFGGAILDWYLNRLLLTP